MSDNKEKTAGTVNIVTNGDTETIGSNSSSSSELAIPNKEAGTVVEVDSKGYAESCSDEQMANLLKKMGYERCEDTSEIPPEIRFVCTKIEKLSVEEAVEILKEGVEYHEDDPNIPSNEYAEYVRFANGDYDHENEKEIFELKALAGLLKFHSPYAEVRAVVEPSDDPTIPVETFRAYFLALVWGIVGSGFNEFFSHRLVSISISTSVVQMFLYLCGTLWAKHLPCWGFTVKGKRFALNIETPWTDKEQMFATLLFAICNGVFYTHYNILTQKIYYGDKISFGYQFWLSICIQFIGFGFAGILRRFVVYPARALWPTSMSTIALNKALLSREKDVSKGLSRYSFFFIATTFMFLYTWFPTYLINILNTFNWMTWIAPNNFDLAAITGGVSGLGINPISSFDWNVINFLYPLVTPFFSYSVQFAGSFFAALVVIAVYYTNYKDCQYLPIFSNSLFTNTGTPYSIKKILNSDYKVDEEKYQQYSPPFYSAGNLVSYGSFIAVYPLLIIYAFITESKVLLGACKDWAKGVWSLRKWQSWTNMAKQEYHALDNFNDPHSNMMKKYKEVPDWWYFMILLISIVISIIVLEKYETNTPIWALFMSLGFNFVFLIPITILQATTGFSIGLNLLIEMIIGYALPGNPYALMIVKAFGYNIDGQADNYVSNLKMAHYCKIPPVALFRGQLFMVFVQVLVNLGVLNWQISNIKDFCQPNQASKFTCPDARTYYNASVMWGAMGPKKIFNDVYPILRWCWLIGACLGVFFGLWKIYGRRYYATWFNPILFVGGMINMGPPYGLMYVVPGFFASFFSQFYLKKYHLRLWEKYNYVCDAAFSAGLVFSSIVIFFAVQYKQKDLNWWGNTVIYAGLDGEGLPKKDISQTSKGYFGPAPGHYP